MTREVVWEVSLGGDLGGRSGGDLRRWLGGNLRRWLGRWFGRVARDVVWEDS